jgi:hypothetical protein
LTGAKVAVLLAALFGHAAFWVGSVNRIHGLGLPRKVVRSLSAACHAMLVSIPLVFAWWLLIGGQVIPSSPSLKDALEPARAYLLICLTVALVHLPAWIRLRRAARAPAAVVRHQVRSVDVAARLGRWPAVGLKARLLARVPGNQLFHVDVDEEEVELERLPAELAGISILHLSDFHFSGRVEPDYFHEVVRLANDLQPDLLAITGDICDFTAGIDWVTDIFAGLAAPLGKFFVLGNHDLRTRNVPRLRAAMVAVGFADVASAPMALELRGCPVLVAGNERPWTRSPEPFAQQAAPAAAGPLRILLSHSPDQFDWARERQFDLMLAGHTHGGQIRLPWIGPVVCPSLHGIRFAGGTFFAPPTLMHVSRGISSLLPLRLSCPCEITKLVLRPPRSSG